MRKETIIKFNPAMLRAIEEDRKTQTRRIIKPQPSPCGLRKLTPGDIAVTGLNPYFWYGSDPFTEAFQCPYGDTGDLLFVEDTRGPRRVITLEIESVRVERLIEITREDCIAEGVSVLGTPQKWGVEGFGSGLCWMNPEGAFRELWESINGPGSWDANPWVWVIQFRRIQ